MNFSGFLGNDALKTRLENSKRSHAYIISGAEGSGRYTLATILSADMLCTGDGERPCRRCRNCQKIFKGIHPDVVTIDLEKDKREITVAQVRDICGNAAVMPNEADGKVYIIKNAGKMNGGAQNAILKVLEEPPAGSAFILIAEHPGELIETVRSRCTELNITPLGFNDVEAFLYKTYPEKTQAEIELAARRCQGIIGRGIKMLESGDDTAEALTKAFETAVMSGSDMDMLKFTASIEKLERQTMNDFLESTRIRFAELLKEAEKNRSLDKVKIYDTILMLEKLLKALNFNVNSGHISGLMLAELIDIQK